MHRSPAVIPAAANLDGEVYIQHTKSAGESARAENLLRFLKTYPQRLEEPSVRLALAAAVVSCQERCPALETWAAQLAPGPVVLQDFPRAPIFSIEERGSIRLSAGPAVDPAFFPRWDQRLGEGLVPALDRSNPIGLGTLTQDDQRMIYRRMAFTGAAEPRRLSPLARQALFFAPEDVLPHLFSPGGLLAEESPAALLDGCQALPLHRRRIILPRIRKEESYAL